MGVVMATIALLLTATLITEGAGMLFHVLLQDRNEQTTCFDLFISSFERDSTRFDEYLAYIDGNVPIRESRQYDIYRGKDTQVTRYVISDGDYWQSFDYDTIMKASDYLALRAMLGYPEVSLKPGQYLIHCMPYLEKGWTAITSLLL